MPYTPPSQQSPASSKASTPAMSRNPSYSHDIAHLSPTHGRPALPRSMSSAAYLSKHRRSPSATSQLTQEHPAPVSYRFSASSRDAESILSSASIRQSPPPRNDLVIPSGAIISPPDSSENSDGDESNNRDPKRRDVETTWNELQQAVRSMSIKRDPSPVKNAPLKKSVSAVAFSVPTTALASPAKLTPEARKIIHSRSSTEHVISHLMPVSSSQTSGSEDSDDDMHAGKPPLVRKKSGELVKPALRASSRRRYSSMPGTPTYSKSVHFNDDGNQTRHFLQVDKPSAVSAGASPVEVYENEAEFPFDASQQTRVEWDIKLANFPSEDYHARKTRPIWVERFFLSADNKSLIGQVAVANISFQKYVTARFTLDYWKTTSEVSAEFSHDVRQQQNPDGYDRFSFTIRLADQANLETKTLLLCMRYNVCGQEHWDSNDDTNYQIDFVKKINRPPAQSYASPLGARPIGAIPRSRHGPPTSRGRQRAPSMDDDMSAQIDSSYHFGTSTRDLLGDEAQPTIKLKSRSRRGHLYHQGPPHAGQGLGGRYDFGASLSAALSTAQDKLGKQSGLMHQKSNSVNEQGYFTTQSADCARQKTVEPTRPEALTTDRPAMGSAQYKDLVNKFCYFTPTPASGKMSPQVQIKAQPGSNDGMDEQDPYFSSGSRSPSPQRGMSPQLDGANDRLLFHQTTQMSPFVSRTVSPGDYPGSHPDSRGDTSPGTFGFPYTHRDGYLADSHAPTAIRG